MLVGAKLAFVTHPRAGGRVVQEGAPGARGNITMTNIRGGSPGDPTVAN